MVQETFNSAVIASAYTGWIIIPESVEDLYQSVGPLRDQMAELGGFQDMDVLSPEFQARLRAEMEKHFPNLQRFEAAGRAVFDKGGDKLSREEAWPHMQEVAANLIGDHSLSQG